MPGSPYDEHTAFYLDFVDAQLADPHSQVHLLLQSFESALKGVIGRARVCDLACGEGYLSRWLYGLGASEVVGIDLSENLINAARSRNGGPGVTFRLDDAHELGTLADGVFDVAVSQMAIMDIPDVAAFFAATRRILKPGGTFAFSMLHPCFESPFHLPDRPPFLLDGDGNQVARLVQRYATEGFWQSGGTGVRGHMGAYHRTLTTVVNELISAGFQLVRMEEPVAESGGLAGEVPGVLVFVASAA